MKVMLRQLISIVLMVISYSASAQDTATVHRVNNLELGYYIEQPTYTINKNYVVYEYRETRKIIYSDIPSFKTGLTIYYGSGFAMNKDGIFFKGEFFKTDTTGFKVVAEQRDGYGHSDWLWKTNQKVFKNDRELKYIDAKTFSALNNDNEPGGGNYFKDKDAIFYFDKKLENSDPVTGKRYGEIAYDKNNVFQQGKLMYNYGGEKLLPVNGMIIKTTTTVFNFREQAITKMDAATLKGLSRYYSIDKNHVYFDTIALPIKPENFNTIKTWEYENLMFISDGINVYNSAGYLEADLDAKTFGMVPNSHFYYDKNGVYETKWINGEHKNVKIPFNYTQSISVENAFIINNYYYYLVYGDQLYDFHEKLHKNISADKIRLLVNGGRFVFGGDEIASKVDRNFLKINDHYFFLIKDEAIKNADYKIHINNTLYFKDDKHVYYYNQILNELELLPGVDPNTFEIFNGFVSDKDYIYFNKRRLLSRKKLQLLAIYADMQSSSDAPTNIHFYLFKNTKGFWLFETSREPQMDYLGKKFNRKLNKAFEKLNLDQAQ